MRVWLGDKRIEKGLSQRMLAEKISVSVKSISAYETGRRTPLVPVAKEIAELLGFEWTKFYD